MPEGVTLPATGQSVAVDIIGGDAYQRVKMTFGVDGVALDASVTNPLPVVQTSVGYTPRAADAHAIVTGGTAVTVVSGPVKGGYITNPASVDAQGIGSTENLYIDFVNTPTVNETDANNTASMLRPGESFNIPALAAGVVLKANGATNGHKFVAVVW